jgi:glycosyltransferase involved in cell wall biosynthesis
VVPPRDADALARAILAAAADPAETAAMAGRAAARYDATYTIRRMVEAHEELFARLA